jgi:hypothetical protein
VRCEGGTEYIEGPAFKWCEREGLPMCHQCHILYFPILSGVDGFFAITIFTVVINSKSRVVF